MRFADVHKMIRETRDFSEAALNNLWKSAFNRPLQEGQKLV